MKERPILFSAPMVRAILDGRKTQTRRVVTHPGLQSLSFIVDCGDGWWGDEEGDFQALCPYGKRGDRLWVRETWAHDAETFEQCRASREDALGGGAYGPYYRATEIAPDTLFWRPSIHMPRWASRITLEITAVRVERLQDISLADARAEGAPPCHPSIDAIAREFGFKDWPRSWYAQLWDGINSYGWDTNPLVWVLEFKRV